MNKKFLSVFSLIALLAVSCKQINESSSSFSESVSEKVPITSSDSSVSAITELTNLIKETLPTSINGDFQIEIPSGYDGATVSFVSSSLDVLKNDGTYLKPENDTSIELTITITYQNEQQTFSHTLVAEGYTINEKVEAIKAELVLEQTEVWEDFLLPTSTLYQAEVTWVSKNTDYIVIEGNLAKVTRPIETFEDEEVTLQANIVFNHQKYEKTIPVIVLALQVTEISVSSLPSQLHYPLHTQTIDVQGGSIQVLLDNHQQKTIDMKAEMIKEFDTSTTGNHLVTIAYQGCETTFAISVYEPSHAIELALNETILETFDDEWHPKLSFDAAQTSNSQISEELSLRGSRSLYIESDGSFKTLYLKDFVSFQANETYQINFTYKVLQMQDTIYFQIAGTNVFTQFGDLNRLNEEMTFSWLYSSSVASDLIQIFPGGATGKTCLIIDDISVKHVVSENNVYKETLEVEDYVLETFGDPNHAVLTIDQAPAPATKIISENGITGASLQFESDGNYQGIYIKTPSGLLQENATYKVTFDYQLLSFVDTLYFQYYNFDVPTFKEFGSVAGVNEIQTFEMEVTVTDPSCLFHIFPGGGTGKTTLLIDNFKIERII